MGKQVNKLLLGCILYPAEDIAKVLYRIQMVVSDIGKDGHEPCEAHPGLRTAGKETVVAVLRYPAYLAFADVVRQVQTAVLSKRPIFPNQYLKIFSSHESLYRSCSISSAVRPVISLMSSTGNPFDFIFRAIANAFSCSPSARPCS